LGEETTRTRIAQRVKLLLSLLLICLPATNVYALGQELVAEQLAPGTSLKHFAQIDTRVFVGSKPKTDEDFAFLQSKHIRYILNAHFLPFLSGGESRKAKRYGIRLLSMPMNASPVPPSAKHVNRILLTLRDRQYQPIYLHCVLGRDRTSLIAGLYKIYFLGLPKDKAYHEMLESDFKTWWFTRGLKSYFRKHSSQPPNFPPA
jgi:hypothetical protein